LLLLIHTSVCH